MQKVLIDSTMNFVVEVVVLVMLIVLMASIVTTKNKIVMPILNAKVFFFKFDHTTVVVCHYRYDFDYQPNSSLTH